MEKVSKDRSKDLIKRYGARVADFRKTFETPHGQAVLLDLFQAHGMMMSTFQGDAYNAAYLEGQRSVVLRILNILSQKPDKIKEMIAQAEREHV